jgi:Zn-dependent protease with chaperone function
MVRARFFDGRTSRVHEVVLRPLGGELAVEGDGVALRVPLERVEVGEPLEQAARLIALPDGARCEVERGPELDLLLELLGHREGRVSRWQRRWTLAIGSAALTLALLGGGYRYGLPWLAERIARRVPDAWVRALGSRTLDALDELAFEPSRLDPERPARLAARLARLRAPGGGLPPHRLHFRRAELANAFALPGGDIVVTDELVELAASDDEVVGVLAHELGHLHGRHGLRSLIQSSIVGAVVALWFGDVSSLGAGAPAFVLEAKYSRDFEREADAYAAALLRASGLDTRPLAEMLARLAARQGEEGAPLVGYLSSHPATAERIRALAAADR